MRYIVTSHQRPRHRQQETLRNLPPSIADQAELWVQEGQVGEYAKWWLDLHILPTGVTRLGATRQYLVDRYRGEKIVLMDDDLTFYIRQNPADWHLTIPSPEDLEGMFAEIEALLNRYAHVGVSGRERQNTMSGRVEENTRYMRLLAYNTALWPDDIRCDRVDGMSDFDACLQLLRAGLPCAVLTRHAQGQRATQTPGGMAGQRSHESHSAEVAALCELHPGLVTPTQKQNRSGGPFGYRDEVIVSWKYALGWNSRPHTPSPYERLSADLTAANKTIASLNESLAILSSSLNGLAVELAFERARIRRVEEERDAALRDATAAIARATRPVRRSRTKRAPDGQVLEDGDKQEELL